MKLGVFLLFVLLLLSSIDVHAFDCAKFRAFDRNRLRLVTANSTVACPSGQVALFSPAEFAQFQQMQIDLAALRSASAGTVFDPVLAGSLWMFAITIILGCWLLAKNAGIIIDMVKRW